MLEEQAIDQLNPIDKVKVLPERYFSFLESRLEGQQQIGTLLTADNLKAIKRYVNAVHQMPRTAQDIAREVDYAALGIDVTLVHDLYAVLHAHVNEWDILERCIKQLGPEIESFAESLVYRGGVLMKNLEDSESFQAIEKRKTESDGDTLTMPLTEDEQAQVAAVMNIGIAELVREIQDTSRRIDEVDKRANFFNSQIKRELRPRMTRLVKHFDDKVSYDELIVQRDQMDQWDIEIDQLKSEYDALVGYAFTGLALGPLGLIVTGGVFGAKAEAVRARKNALIAQLNELANHVGKALPALEDFLRVSTLVKDLQFRCKDLSSATKRLADVWLFLASYAKTSAEEANDLKTVHQLESFVQDFSEVIKPWKKIGSICHTLSGLFNEMVEELEEF